MKNQIRLKFQICTATLIVGILTTFAQNVYADEHNKNLFPSNQNLNKDKEKLIPMPTGNLESALFKVNVKRNPFQKPLKSEITNIDDLYLTLKLKGVAKSGNNSLAIIESEKIQKFYKIGDILNNGFFIKSISFEDISVDISNGSKNYRLILNNLRKSL